MRDVVFDLFFQENITNKYMNKFIQELQIKELIIKLIFINYKYLHNDTDDINLDNYILWDGGIED